MSRWIAYSVAACSAGLAALPLSAWADYGDGEHMMWGAGGMAGMGGLFGIVMMLIMIALIAAVVALIWRAINPGRDRSLAADSALAILRERYAKGEIDKTEYDERRRALET
jgi:putative membrane protein